MAYTALYRKFRPSQFEDVKGQEAIVTTLQNQIHAGRIGHAYLFCGTRGTGKTTIAKILAKAVNCEHPENGSPCNQCSMCKAINQQTSMNVIEIDAASNNGVDNIREIVEEVQYSPTEGKYKVYIIDEVHMLSTGAFNALLKTLEEPPSYVMFILATTEAHKIPITILSRCQRYDFKRIGIDVIADRLKELLQKEGIEAEEKAIRYVAKAADGSMRDGLSLLDQCIAFYLGQTLTYDKVLEVLGAVDTEVFARLFQAVIENSVVDCIEILEEMITTGRELTQFVTEFIWYLRNLLLVKTSEQSVDMIEVSTEQYHMMEEQAEKIEVEALIRYIRILSELSNQIRYASQKRVLIEIAFIKLCRPQMETDMTSVLERIRMLEQQMEKGIKITSVESHSPDKAEAGIKKEKREIPLEKAVPEDLQAVAKEWNRILMLLPASIKAGLSGAIPSVGEGNTLLLVFQDELSRDYFDNGTHIEEVVAAIRKHLQKEVQVQTKYIDQQKESMDQIVDLTKFTKMDIEIED